jgi:hypothetical protein
LTQGGQGRHIDLFDYNQEVRAAFSHPDPLYPKAEFSPARRLGLN